MQTVRIISESNTLHHIWVKFDETISYLASAYSSVVQKDYKSWLPKSVIGSCVKNGVVSSKNNRATVNLRASEICKVLWDFLIHSDKKLGHRQPDIFIEDEIRKKNIALIDHVQR